MAGAVARATLALEEAQRRAFEGEKILAHLREEAERWLADYEKTLAKARSIALGAPLSGPEYERLEATREQGLAYLQAKTQELAALQDAMAAAQAELDRATERAARRAQQARERRARKSAERHRKRGLLDPEYVAWLRRQGQAPA